MVNKSVIIVAGVLVCCVGEVWGELRRGEYHSESAARAELERFAKSYNDLKEWEVRAAGIREGILRGAKLWPLPKKGELRPVIHSKREYEGYSVENVAFESYEGFYVTGNLYRPTKGKGPFAGVLCPFGHFKKPNGGGRFRPDQQYRSAGPGGHGRRVGQPTNRRQPIYRIVRQRRGGSGQPAPRPRPLRGGYRGTARGIRGAVRRWPGR